MPTSVRGVRSTRGSFTCSSIQRGESSRTQPMSRAEVEWTTHYSAGRSSIFCLPCRLEKRFLGEGAGIRPTRPWPTELSHTNWHPLWHSQTSRVSSKATPPPSSKSGISFSLVSVNVLKWKEMPVVCQNEFVIPILKSTRVQYCTRSGRTSLRRSAP